MINAEKYCSQIPQCGETQETSQDEWWSEGAVNTSVNSAFTFHRSVWE